MDDVDAEDGVVVDGSGQRDDERLVPVGTRVADLVDPGGALAVGVHPKDGVGSQGTMSPIDILEVHGGAELDFYFVFGSHLDEDVRMFPGLLRAVGNFIGANGRTSFILRPGFRP